MLESPSSGPCSEAITVPLPGLTVPSTPALSALSASVLIGTQRVGLCRVMELLATSLFNSVIATRTSSQIHTSCDWFKMSRVDTMPYSTKMIEINLLTERTILLDIESSMSKLGPQEPSTELAISVDIPRSIPKPAAIMINGVPDPIINEGTSRAPLMTESSIVFLTHAKPEASRGTFLIRYKARTGNHTYILHQLEEVML